jgi:hypothetical protein
MQPNHEAFKLRRDTLRLAVKEYGWHRVPRQWPGTNADDLTSQRRYRYGLGKFQGEHWSIVHWYEAFMNGDRGEEFGQWNGPWNVYKPNDTERAAFEITPDNYIALHFSDSGFVSMQELTQCEYESLVYDYEYRSRRGVTDHD